MAKNQKIECDVETCKNLDCDKKLCLLKKIKVSSSPEEAKTLDDTICLSYEEK